MPRIPFILSAVAFLLFSFEQKNAPVANASGLVTGIVVADNTGKPLARVHVYVVDGEEEALTNNRGEFRIETTAKFPVQVTAEHQDYFKYRTAVNSSGQKLVIRMKPKS